MSNCLGIFVTKLKVGMLNHYPQYSWPHPKGPFNGNAAFDQRLSPPLKLIWKQAIGKNLVGGRIVGGKQRIVVPVNNKDIKCLQLSNGQLIWERKNCRMPESECFLAGHVLWTEVENSTGDFTTLLTELDRGQIQEKNYPRLIPQGVFEYQDQTFLRLRDGIVSLDGTGTLQARKGFYGKLWNGLAYGLLDNDAGDLVSGEGLHFELSCHNPFTEEIYWSVGPGDNVEMVIAVHEKALITHDLYDVVRIRAKQDGQLYWKFSTQHSFDHLLPFLISDDLIFHWEGSHLQAHHLLSGSTIWSYRSTSGQYRSNLIATHSHIWTCSPDQNDTLYLMAFEKSRGNLVWSHPIEKQFSSTNALFLIDNALLLIVGQELLCFLDHLN